MAQYVADDNGEDTLSHGKKNMDVFVHQERLQNQHKLKTSNLNDFD